MPWTKIRMSALKYTVITSLLLTALLLATSCASGPAGTTKPDQQNRLTCAGWKPICPNKSDVDTMSDSLYNQILEHNLFGAKVCKWAPGDCK
jgi:hypothetical protein